ncbi:hypothetical protein EDD11_002950 [Mortierella claussenii]|nr:hypothetical protein EDD11_002950 [Mortierella claussenii]
MSSRIKGLFSNKKKGKDERGSGTTKSHPKDVFGTPSALSSTSSFPHQTRALSTGSFASSSSLSQQGETSVNQTLTPSVAANTLDSIPKQQIQPETTTRSALSKTLTTSSIGATDTAAMIADTVVEGLALPITDADKTAPAIASLSPSVSEQLKSNGDATVLAPALLVSSRDKEKETTAAAGLPRSLERPSEGDEFPVLQYKVTKLQKQVREMRKFMRGLVQLQVEQYEPATILIQAWWRGCLVRRELKKQMVFSWHRNPRRKVKPIKYLTRVDLHQSCDRISTPKASLLVAEDLGADKEAIAAVKLQAVFRRCLVQQRVRAYREGMRAATVIQARWRGYRTRNLDTRLGVEQLRFRNLKIQKAFGRVSIKLQYLQGRILALEENSLPLHQAQELIHKEIEDMADQIDGLKDDLEQGLKQLDEQVSEEKEQTTIELRGLTERIQKLEDELKSVRNSNTSIEKQVKSLTLELPASNMDTGKSDQEDDDEDYEVEYDEDGNRIERPPKRSAKRVSVHESHQEAIAAGAGPRRTSAARPVVDSTVTGSPIQMVESPVPMPQPQHPHRGSIGSIHSQGHTRALSLSSQPSSSPSQAFQRAFSASYSPTISNAAAQPEGGAFANGARPHSIAYSGANNNSNSAPRPLTMDPNQLFRFHPAANQFIPLSPSSASTTAAAGTGGFPGLTPADSKKYVSMDDFEYMQAEVDTLRLNNDRLEGMVRDLTMRLNTLTSNMGQFYPA